MGRPDHQKNAVIGIVPVGDVAALAPKVIAAHVSGYLGLETLVLPPVALPAGALDPQRLQYDAGKMIAALETGPYADDYLKLVGVVDVDICLPIFTHVFGEARQGGKWALVSLYQLHAPRSTGQPPASAYERMAKIALHEIGHLFNLRHCEDPGCLMQFSGGLTDLDLLPFYFCQYCRTFFKEAISTDGRSPSQI